MSAIITEWQDDITSWVATDMNPPIVLLDKYAAIHHNAIVSCDGELTYNEGSGSLAWSGVIRVMFNASDGKLIENTVAVGNISISDNEFVYMDLNESDGTEIILGVSTITSDSASNTISQLRLVFGYRNSTNDKLYLVALTEAFGTGGTADTTSADTTNFDNNLSAADDTVQKALETLDELTSSGTGIESIMVATSDEITDLTTGLAKITFRIPYAFTLSDVRASVNVAPTDANINVDIKENGVSILSTILSIDASEKTSTTATTPVVISDANLADDSEITIDINQVGSTIAGTGLKITLIGIQS